MFQIPLELLGILLAAFAIYVFAIFQIIRSKPKKEEERANPPSPGQLASSSLLFEQERTPVPATIVQDKETERTKHETLDALLTEAVKQNINRLDVAPEITLTNKGEYRILGKTWSGEVNITIKPKKTGEETTEKTEEKTVEETAGEKEESLF